MDKRFDSFVETVITDAGWFCGRSVNNIVSDWNHKLKSINKTEMFPEAEVILNEFGGIKVKEKRDFSKQTFEIDPTLALGEDDRFIEFSNNIETNLYPLGEAIGGYYFLAVAETGQIFWLMQDIFIIGNTFDEALSRMILGCQPEPILL